MDFRELLKSKRYNFLTMAKELGVTHATVSGWAKKKSTPNPETIKRMSELLEVTTDEVINALLAQPKNKEGEK